MASRRGVWLFAFVLVALMINLPFAHNAWTRHKISDQGLVTTVEVVDTEPVPDADDPKVFFISYKFPEEVDADQKQYDAEVDEETFNFARTSKQVEVQYLEDDPSAHVVQGEVRRKFPWVLLGLGDFALLVFLGLYLKFGRRDTTLKLMATSDIERSRSEMYGLSQVSADEWVVIGEISNIVGDVVTLVTEGGREVEVALAEYENKVGYQQPCQVRGRELPRERPSV